MPEMNYDIGHPNPKQVEFLYSKTKFTAYGGARGGGKSWIVRRKAVLMALNYPGIKVLMLRRTYPEVQQNHIQPMLEEIAELIKGKAVKYKQADTPTMFFYNGSKIYFGYLQTVGDLLRYQGQQYDVIFLDEATQFTEKMFQDLTATLRGANSFPKRFYLTANPGGVGHAWFKRLFIDRNFKPTEDPDEYRFIQANVYDNTALMEADPGYVRLLENLPPDQRAAWLEGSWEVFEGQYFPEFSVEKHVYKSAETQLPDHWRKYFAMDYGLDMLAGYWAAMDEKGDCWVYREVFQSNLLMSEAASLIREKTGGECIEEYAAPPDMWNRRQDTGRDVAEAFADYGVYLTKANNDRVTGWGELKEWLKIREDGTARLHISDTCQHLIESIPMLLHSAKDPNDVAGEPHIFTHAPDALRYLISSRPAAAGEKPGPVDYDSIQFDFDNQINSFLNFGM